MQKQTIWFYMKSYGDWEKLAKVYLDLLQKYAIMKK